MEYRAWVSIGTEITSIKVKARSKEEAKKILRENAPNTAKIGFIEKVK